MKKTISGYSITATAFLEVDMNVPATVAAMPEKLKALGDALRDLGFADWNIATKFRHRRAIEQRDPQS